MYYNQFINVGLLETQKFISIVYIMNSQRGRKLCIEQHYFKA